MVSTVFEKRDALKELFHHILEHHDEYDEDSVRCADGFKVPLDDFEFCFLLHTFNGISEYSDMLFAILQGKKLDVQFCLARVKEFCDTVEQERGRFWEIYEASERTTGTPIARRGPAQEAHTHYHQLHSKILDNILCQMQTRFQDHEKFMFLTLLDPQKFREYQKKFPYAAFSSFTESWYTIQSVPAENRTD